MVAATHAFKRNAVIGLMRLTRIYKYTNCTMCRTQCSKCAGCKWYSKARWIQGAVHCHRCEPDKSVIYRHNYSRAEYKCWKNMIARCTQPGHQLWDHYGGRGITVCKRWLKSYKHFIDDMGPRPSNKHSIDRIDNDGGYSPDNCRWATWKQQANNQRKPTVVWGKRYEFNGESLTVRQWAQRLGVQHETMRHRLETWPIEAAVAGRKPVKPLPTIAFDGTEASIAEWANALGLGIPGLKARLRRMPLDQALSKPRYVHTKFHKAS